MDTLKGKQIMVWTFMGNTRMYQALRDYGDRISQIGLFSFKVRATGEIYESGVSIADVYQEVAAHQVAADGRQ